MEKIVNDLLKEELYYEKMVYNLWIWVTSILYQSKKWYFEQRMYL